MPWETHPANGRRYYYRTCRRGDRFVKEYVGHRGEPAIELLHRQRRLFDAERVAAVEWAAIESDAYVTIERALRELHRRVRKLGELYLGANPPKEKAMERPPSADRDPDPKNSPLPEQEEFDALADAAEAHVPGAEEALEAFLRRHRRRIATALNVSQVVERLLVRFIGDASVKVRKLLPLAVDELRRRLGGDVEDPLLGLAIDAAVLAWLDHHAILAAAAQPRSRLAETDKWDRRVGRSRDRFDAALRLVRDLRPERIRPDTSHGKD